MPAFFVKLRDGGTGPNMALLVGHGSVREAVVGPEDVAPTRAQFEEMGAVVRRAMEAGAVGLSTSLRYGTGAYASTEEIVAMARIAAPYGGIYATHMRDEGTRIVEALEEALRIEREARIPVHVSHHKISSASVFGLTRRTLEMIDAARAAGRDVTLDQYPYGAGSSNLSLCVPSSSLSGDWTPSASASGTPRRARRIVAAVQEFFLRKLYESDRGRIRRGAWADVVVFDPETIADRATFLEPHRHSVGVEHVFVRGTCVLKGGAMTGARPGRPLDRQGRPIGAEPSG